MGRGMAANLQRAGHELVVHDRTQDVAAELVENGAVWAATPRAVAEQCTVVFTSLPTPSDVETVGLGDSGLRAGFSAGATWFDLSTNDVDVVRRLNVVLLKERVHFLDAPVSGGPAGAASGRLAIWVGGERTIFDRHRHLLEVMADQPRYIGAIGSGTIAKLVNNMASTAINAVVTEALTLGVKAGLDLLPLWESIRHSVAGRSRSYDNMARRFLQGRLDPPNFKLRLVQKDVALALRLGRDTNVPLRLCSLVAQDIAEAMNCGWADRDSQSFLVLQQQRAGVAPFALNAEEVERVLRQ
jgi:3-hydroxyisobutyrate dehydrogenase